MVRAPCCEKMGLKRGPWTPEEDEILISYVHKNGHSNWRALPKQAGLLRCGKSCRLRWINYLRPDIKRGNFTKEEEATIIKLHENLGNRWSAIAARLPGRTDNEIKNVWHTHLKKRLKNYQPPPHKAKRQSSNMPNSCDDPKVSEQGNNVNTGSFDRQESISFYQNGNAINACVPVSPEDSSNSEMSSVTDSSAPNMFNNSNHVEIKQEEMDSLWSKELPNKDHAIFEESKPQVSSSINVNTMMCDNLCSSKLEDDMDFWFNLFIKPGDFPELLQF